MTFVSLGLTGASLAGGQDFSLVLFELFDFLNPFSLEGYLAHPRCSMKDLVLSQSNMAYHLLGVEGVEWGSNVERIGRGERGDAGIGIQNEKKRVL